jgi:hypothetical protein
MKTYYVVEKRYPGLLGRIGWHPFDEQYDRADAAVEAAQEAAVDAGMPTRVVRHEETVHWTSPAKAGAK